MDGKSIRERCRVSRGDEADRFVGLKADTGNVTVSFPMGYQLPDNDDELRADIHHLLYVLADFLKEEQVMEEASRAALCPVAFPVHAYLKVIRDFLRRKRYYVETDRKFKTDVKGYASWLRTAREQRALVQRNGSLIFTSMTVRAVTPDVNKKITQIHRYCVYEAFDKMGWLYVPHMPEKPGPHPGNREAVYILEKKLASTHNDAEQELFSAMMSMLNYMDERSDRKQNSYGTEHFERVWERMIDRAFGIADKEAYFPRARWLLDYGPGRRKRALQPDTVMLYNGNVYVLDAKLYRYGCSGNPDHLPDSADINKQITYGEYIERTKGVPGARIYNAFLMPFNRADNIFCKAGPEGEPIFCVTDDIGNIGEAVGDWKPHPKRCERVQGIVIDTRFLLYHYMGMPEEKKRLLAEAIQKVDARGPVPEPAE